MKTAIALGTFDGLHEGHRAVLEKILPFYSIAVTFKLPPKAVITGKPQLLILPQERKKRLCDFGINQVVMQDFDDVRNIDALDYLKNLRDKYHPSLIACGFNYRFGKNALGDSGLLQKFCNDNNIEFCCVPPQCDGDKVISSTVIRDYIKNGNVKKASSLLYGGFGFMSTVLHGDARGRTIGFPTANQAYPELLVKPKFGVYISKVTVDGNEYKAITNIGLRPTFKTEKIGCETYIKGLSKDLYGKEVKIELLDFVREEKKFDSVEQLETAIKKDVNLLD